MKIYSDYATVLELHSVIYNVVSYIKTVLHKNTLPVYGTISLILMFTTDVPIDVFIFLYHDKHVNM